MQASAVVRPIEQVVKAIEQLDLDPIKFKLMDPEEGQGWSREYADRMELAYKRFLILLTKYPDETIAPSKDIDKFWHGHILDTLKYTEDCERTLGYYLHHFPYFGMRGEDDAKNLGRASDAMSLLYEREFGEPLTATPAFCIKAAERKAGAAFCIKGDRDSAFCITAAQAKQNSAFCIKGSEPKEAAAFCIKGAVDSAFCIAAAEAKRDSAFCINASARKAEPSFCIKAAPDSGFCIRAPERNADASFCIRASASQRARPDVVSRPRLVAA